MVAYSRKFIQDGLPSCMMSSMMSSTGCALSVRTKVGRRRKNILKIRAFFVYSSVLVQRFLFKKLKFRIPHYANEGFKINAHKFLYLLCFWHCTMEVIFNELQNGDVDIDMNTLSYHIQQCLKQYKTMYEQMAILPVDRAVARALIGVCIFIYSCYARLISFEINPNDN